MNVFEAARELLAGVLIPPQPIDEECLVEAVEGMGYNPWMKIEPDPFDDPAFQEGFAMDVKAEYERKLATIISPPMEV